MAKCDWIKRVWFISHWHSEVKTISWVNILLWVPSSQSKHVCLFRWHTTPVAMGHTLHNGFGLGWTNQTVAWWVSLWTELCESEGLFSFKQWAHCQHACRKTQRRGTLAWLWLKYKTDNEESSFKHEKKYWHADNKKEMKKKTEHHWLTEMQKIVVYLVTS